MELCRIILVDDHSLFRSGMRGLLDRYDGIRVVGEASTGEEFLAMLPATEADVVFMDPPRSGSTEAFLDAVARLAPKTVVYISCGPETQARDVKYLLKKGYRAEGAWPVDMFPMTDEIENICLLKKI